MVRNLFRTVQPLKAAKMKKPADAGSSLLDVAQGTVVGWDSVVGFWKKLTMGVA